MWQEKNNGICGIAFEVIIVRRERLWANINLFSHSIEKNMTCEPQVTYWQLYIFENGIT